MAEITDDKPFDPKGDGYDHKTAKLYGLKPSIDPDDGLPHWPSRVPQTGMLLKGKNHPTFDKGVDEDRKLGYGLNMKDGRYYTDKYAKGGAVPDFAKGGASLPRTKFKWGK